MRLALIQLFVTDDKTENVRRACEFLEQAKQGGADIAVLPEMFCCPYSNSCFPSYAEPMDGFVQKTLSETAARLGMTVVAGSYPELCGGKIYNTACVYGADGSLIAKHRKMHLFDINVPGGQCFRESDTLTAGDEVTVFDTEFGRMGLCICYDVRFPELARLMALQGARMVLVPAAFNLTTGPAHWELVYRSEAMYNQMFYVATSPARDMEASYHAWGHSLVADPKGGVVAMMDEKEGYQVTELNLADVEPVRQQIPMLQQRRTDLYELKKI